MRYSIYHCREPFRGNKFNGIQGLYSGHSGITPGMSQGAIGTSEIKPRLAECQTLQYYTSHSKFFFEIGSTTNYVSHFSQMP